MKIVIDLPEDYYNECKRLRKQGIAQVAEAIIANGKPYEERPIDDLSEYSDRLWKKAYERGKAEGRPQGEERMFNPYDHRGITEI